MRSSPAHAALCRGDRRRAGVRPDLGLPGSRRTPRESRRARSRLAPTDVLRKSERVDCAANFVDELIQECPLASDRPAAFQERSEAAEPPSWRATGDHGFLAPGDLVRPRCGPRLLTVPRGGAPGTRERHQRPLRVVREFGAARRRPHGVASVRLASVPNRRTHPAAGVWMCRASLSPRRASDARSRVPA
jgi:hypothetical protein